MSNTVTGVLYVKKNKVQVTEKFTKREFLVNTSEQYPQTLKFQLSQAKCDLIDKFNEGDTITVHYNVRGREYISKTTGEKEAINTLDVWRIEKAEGAPQPMQQADVQPDAPTSPDNDELPF